MAGFRSDLGRVCVCASAPLSSDDIAVLLLAEDATVAPFPLPTGSIADTAPGSLVRAVGFGVTARAAADPGVKREGTLALDAVRERAFDATAAPAMTCVADSGGPVLAAIGGSEQLVGITSQGDFACETLATNQRVDVVLDELARPYITQAATAPPGWPSSAMPLDDVGVLPRLCLRLRLGVHARLARWRRRMPLLHHRCASAHRSRRLLLRVARVPRRRPRPRPPRTPHPPPGAYRDPLRRASSCSSSSMICTILRASA